MELKEQLPSAVLAALWSYDPDKIDVVAHKKLIISQVLNYGSKEATDWLFKVYSKEEIAKFASSIPIGQWDEKSLALWSLYLGIKPISRTERILNAR